jgi:hypothetical protein
VSRETEYPQACEGQRVQEQRRALQELLRDMEYTDMSDFHNVYHTLVRLIRILQD